jgi:hypothetical protein
MQSSDVMHQTENVAICTVMHPLFIDGICIIKIYGYAEIE